MTQKDKRNVSNWHALEVEEVLRQVESDVNHGLREEESRRRLEQYGPNELEERGLKSPWRILWEQLTGAVVMILIAAAVISAFLGDKEDAIAIMVIVILNALLGFRQEYKAERAMAALKKMSVPEVRVRRSGSVRKVSARELVRGDIVLLEEGNLAPADCRLVESVNLRFQEAALTGESEPVEKNVGALTGEDIPVADRVNMAYLGAVVTYGRGVGVVVETGMSTELGHIASLIQTVGSELTPLQKRLNYLGRWLAIAALALIAIVFSLGLLRGGDVKVLFLTAISLAVAAIPEGLPAVVTIALALGAQRMLKRKALIRKLPAVETLGSVTVICSDKTGTLTQNRMTVTVLDVAGKRIDLTAMPGSGSTSQGPDGFRLFQMNGELPAAPLLLVGGALCNDAFVKPDGEGPGTPQVMGDPTESAIVLAAAQAGLSKPDLERILPRVAEVPFDSNRKRMSTVHQVKEGEAYPPIIPNLFRDWEAAADELPFVCFTKGGVDSLMDVSSAVLVEDRVEPLNEMWRERILAGNDQLAQKGMRVLGVGYRHLKSGIEEGPDESLERDLVFIGMVGMIDPAREEVKEAVAVCKSAGIRPIMITGDHPLTARYIARELAISSDGRVMTGQEIGRRPVDEIENLIEETSVYARVSPEHKLNIVQALQKQGHIVAMTGDGVNDAPALKKADIGVAMGVAGTDVSKEVADMVLMDDNFATIVAAVEEGRVIYDNIRKFIKYLLTTNSGEILVMLVAPFLGMPLPLLPLQILWINLVTDGLPALALGVEPPERDVMRHPPRRPDESIFGEGLGWHVIWVGVVMGLIPLLLGYFYWRNDASGPWQTMVFTTLTFAQMAHVLAIRSNHYSLFTIGLLSNKPLLGAVLLTAALQLAVIYIPFLQELFKTVALPLNELAYCIGLSAIVFVAVELEKWRLRLRGK
jgi:Ca2+-transporting ATPase